MKAQGIKKETKDSLDLTLLNYEVFRSGDPKMLSFKGTGFSGTYGKNKNHVLFHYSEDKGVLACYALTLYDQQQTDVLIGLLAKAGTMTFKQTHLPKGSVEIDVDGNEVKPGKDTRKPTEYGKTKKRV
ncbi:hypothetical protein ABIB62_004098 [Mucilaginibacter sp. UYP25]|uniref:hypothetical protein n=1 Tax=unclassified Mucilaginibacter TaxID=2617802 RepID=UPI003392A0B8